MIKYSCFLLFILFIFSCSSLTKETKPKTLLWEISSKNGKGKVFLLGSIHLADERIYPLKPVIEESFKSSDILVLEILIDEIDPLSVMQYVTFKDERTLETELPPDVYAKISAMFEENSIPKYIYNKFKPWFAVLTLQSGVFKKSGMTPGEGVDMYFLNKAREKKMQVIEIESLQQQMQVMDELGEFTGEYLSHVLDGTDSAAASLDVMMEAWKNGDDKTIEQLSSEGSDKAEFAEVMEKLNYKRNEKMIEKIQEYLNSDKTYFVIVGAAHVVGQRGIAETLKNSAQYNIKRY